MDNLFRLFFGLPERNHSYDQRRDDFSDTYSSVVNNDDDDEDEGRSRDDFTFAFDVFRPDDIIRQFEGIFASMDALTQSMDDGTFPALAPPSESFKRRSSFPRDQMLKGEEESSRSSDKLEPFKGLDKHAEPKHENSWSRMWQQWQSDETHKSSSKEDTDLDSVVTSQGLDSILPSDTHKSRTEKGKDSCTIIEHFSDVKPFSFSRTFSSTYSYRGADGKSESRQTTKDSDGNTVTRITKSENGESWTEVTKKDRSGNIIESHTEKLSSSDPLPAVITDKEKTEFGSRWKGVPSPRDDMLVQPEAKSDFSSIFRNLFGFHGSRNDRDEK